MNPNFLKALPIILQYEGGLTDDPKDPGGLTNFGISQRAYPNVDIRNLTVEKAGEIYKRDYWDACQCDAMPYSIALFVFDAAVNQGTTGAKKMLQRALNVTSDGIIGNITLTALKTADTNKTMQHMVIDRIMFYTGLSTFSTFGRSWINRTIHSLNIQ